MTSLSDNESNTNYNAKDVAVGKSLSKFEFLDRLAVIEGELKKNLNVREVKTTAEKKILVEELKRRVEIWSDNIHIPFDLTCPTTVCASYDHLSCVSPHPEEVMHLENQLNAALMYLRGNEDDDCSEVMSSESTIDTISDPGAEEDKSLVMHDSEVIFISKNQVQSNTEDPANIFTSTKESTPLPDREAPPNKVTMKSSRRYKGILKNRTDNGNVIRDGCFPSDTKRKNTSSRVKTVRFCNQSSVHLIDAKLSLKDRLAKARGLIDGARNSRQTLVRATV